MPALCAGVSSIGEMTVTNPFCMVMWMPMPVNLPLVSICRSSKASGGSSEECGSSPWSIPLMAFWIRSLASTSSTYSFWTSSITSESTFSCS